MVKQGQWRESTKCKECKGTGKVDQEEITNSDKGTNISVLKVDCPICNGHGWFTRSGTLK